jgi:predicted RNase H-like HicB family nuclease
MQTEKFVHWQQDGFYLGYFVDYPDYWTQGEKLSGNVGPVFPDLN